MSSLYEISAEIEAILAQHVDPETGEIGDEAIALLDGLELARDEKCLHLAAYSKGEKAEAEMVAREIERLQRRQAAHKNRAKRLESYIAEHLPAGTKLEDGRSAISWRKSEAVEIGDEQKVVDKWRTTVMVLPAFRACVEERTTYHVSKKAVKAALQAGVDIPTARIVKRQNLQVR